MLSLTVYVFSAVIMNLARIANIIEAHAIPRTLTAFSTSAGEMRHIVDCHVGKFHPEFLHYLR